MPLYDTRFVSEAGNVKPALAALIVHRLLEKVQEYSETTIGRKWEELQKGGGQDREQLRSLDQWLTYRTFNGVALKEIADGTLDDWFPNLFP